ncbi:MAG: hypothetical protein MJ057_00730 [Sphaerochaetaceae bacterium]|nr:hypothetical protein [Sphaerochaetaceae bacterium]
MHPKQEELERQMSELCQALDNHLEDIYGGHYSIHPNRLKRGMGSNPSFDGLFSTSCSFTLGYGTKSGRGYLVNVEIRTLDRIPFEEKARIQDHAFDYIAENLKTFIPGRDLEVIRENNLMKIVGDFSLGEV